MQVVSGRFLAFLALVGTGLLIGGAADAQPFAYTIKDLGIVPGITYVEAGITESSGLSVNDSGQVVGAATQNSPYHSFLSAPNGGTLQDIGTLGTESVATGVNLSGQVSGYSVTVPHSNDPENVYLYTPGGSGLKDLGTLGGANSRGEAINASGQVAGYSDTTGNSSISFTPYHAFLSGANGGSLTDLGTLGGQYSGGYGVNNFGQVAGTSSLLGDQYRHAFLSGVNGGPLKDLGTLSGHFSSGTAVNIIGQVAGTASLVGDNVSHAFVSGLDGGPLQDLGTLGGTNSTANGINDYGQVVGQSDVTGSSTQHGFLFTNSTLTDLNSLFSPSSGFLITTASAISNTGFITGSGYNASGQYDAFLLMPTTPVPEASTYGSLGVMLALGLGAIVITARCQRKA